MHIVSLQSPNQLCLSIDDLGLLKAYIETSYELHLRAVDFPVALRIGQPYPKILDSYSWDAGLAVMTAWNPVSQPLSLDDNMMRQAAFMKGLKDDGYTDICEAIGRSLTGPWAEKSIGVFDISLEHALQYGSKQGQNAVVWLAKHKVPVIVLCEPFWTKSRTQPLGATL